MTTKIENSIDFDGALLTDIESILSPLDFRTFVEECLASAADRLACAKALCSAADFAGLRIEARCLISTAGNHGFHHASVLARQLEAACAVEDDLEVKALLSD